MKTVRIVLVALVALAAAVAASGAGADPGTTERVSVDSDENEANGSSYSSAISGDGRYVAFWSNATNLVPDDTSSIADIFVRDRVAGTTERVSVDSDESEANGPLVDLSFTPSISAEGRYVAFTSVAANLVEGDTNEAGDIFVHDRQTGTTERVSLDSSGSQSDSSSHFPAINGDGRYVAFLSGATNLVEGDTNATVDVFVRDRQTGTTERVSIDSAGNQANSGSGSAAISGDGRYVAFYSSTSNLVEGDTNNFWDVFVRDRQTSMTERVSVDSGGNQGNGHSLLPGISSDGRYVVFSSHASNLVEGDTNEAGDVFVHDRQTGTTERVNVDSAGNEGSGDDFFNSCNILFVLEGPPSVSGDTRYVAFRTFDSELVPDDTNEAADVFVRDRETESVTVEAGADETVTTDIDGDGPSTWDPSETSLTTPNAGTVSIEETSVTGPPPAGFHFLGQQVSITAPAATTDDPLVIVFRIDSSQVPGGEDENTIQMFKDGVEVPACAGPPGTASPDPCVSNRVLLPDGDVEITVLTSAASAWNFGAASVPVGGIAELPDVSDSAGRNYGALAGLAAAAVVALGAGGWYARRRWLS